MPKVSGFSASEIKIIDIYKSFTGVVFKWMS